MKKQTKTLLVVAAVVGVGYYLWKQNKDKKNFGGFDNVGSRTTLGGKNQIFPPTAQTPIF
jgi:hypothetical protein